MTTLIHSGISRKFIETRLAKDNSQSGLYRHPRIGRSVIYIHPGLASTIQEEYTSLELPPDSWQTAKSTEIALNATPAATEYYSARLAEEHPDWIGYYRHPRLGRRLLYFSPEATGYLQQQLQNEEAVPEGWKRLGQVADSLGVSSSLLAKKVTMLRTEAGQHVRQFRTKHSKLDQEYISPYGAELLAEMIAHDPTPPPEWVGRHEFSRSIQVDDGVIDKKAARYHDEHPEWAGTFRHPNSGHPAIFYHPDLIAQLKKDITPIKEIPDGWYPLKLLAHEVRKSDTFIKGLINSLTQEHPEWVDVHRTKRGEVTIYHPELVDQIRLTTSEYIEAPVGWVTRSELAHNLGIDFELTLKLAKEHCEEHPEWFGIYSDKVGRRTVYYSSELNQALKEQLGEQQAPEGWVIKSELIKELPIGYSRMARFLDTYREEHPEWFGIYRTRMHNQLTEHYHPELITIIKNIYDEVEVATKDWLTSPEASRQLGISPDVLKNILRDYREQFPNWFKLFKDLSAQRGSGKILEHFHIDLIEKIRQEKSEIIEAEIAPDGWQTAVTLVGVAYYKKFKKIAEPYREEHPEWFHTYKKHGRLVEHYAAELQLLVMEQLEIEKTTLSTNKTEKEDQRAVSESLINELENIFEDFSNTDFKDLLNLFGSAAVTDILFQLHPEYKKLPVPYVKSRLAEYLGDFLTLKGGLTLNNLEKGIPFLANPSFQENLMEVIKNQCLQALNFYAKNDPEQVSFETVSALIDEIRSQSEHFSTPELKTVLGDVQAYYELLFENIHKPDYIVDEVEEGRAFPDINQRINVQEIAFKHKMLIADEMGTGKSASAIMAKEILGIKQALIIVPSNVVPVWQGYLSDIVEDDHQVGYFKSGYTPRVLVVNRLEDLTETIPQDYDYIILSQERLNDKYTSALEAFHYDMLIVDEMHKLKNITSGKRAANLMRLAERIDGDDKYLALLSGTPVPNKISDIAVALKLLYPEQFKDIENKQLVNQILNGDMLDLRGLLVPRMQMKSLTENVAMPQMLEKTELIELSEKEQEIYELLIEEDELTAIEKMALLRQFTMNPRILDATPDIIGSKVEKVGERLNELFNEKSKVIMFLNGFIDGMIRGEQTIIEDLHLPSDVTILTIDGEVSKKHRLEIQKQLKTDQKILLMVSGQTADTGVDFSAAEAVVHYNEPWSLYDKQQQTSRVYRPGLKDDLPVYTFIAEDTIEQGVHDHINNKYQAIEKLLRGVPITEIQRNMLKRAERQRDPSIEVNVDIAQHYLSDNAKLARIFGGIKELGEEKFGRFLEHHAADYAEAYANLAGSRSYQANMSRLSNGLIEYMANERGQHLENIEIVDLASGPEMLRRHASEELADHITSLDLNAKHFNEAQGKTIVGSFIHSPLANNSVDYLNLSLGFHYTSFIPSRGNYERLETLHEANRVLRPGGRITIGMVHSLEIPDIEAFGKIAGQLGLRVVDSYTGSVEGDKNFKTQVVTLEKVADCNKPVSKIVTTIDPADLKALKFKKTATTLAGARKVVTKFFLRDKTITTTINAHDQQILEEEDYLIHKMEALKQSHQSVELIPREEIIQRGFARIFNGKRYILFARLTGGRGSVAIH